MPENNNKQNPKIDPVVERLLPNYIKSRRLEIFQLQRLLAENDFDKIRMIGHNLRGSGGLYGLSPISELGKQIEELALDNDQKGLDKSVQALHYFLDNLDY